MTAPFLTDDGRALIFDRVSGLVMTVAVPTALENVTLGQGRFVHGDKGDLIEGGVVEKLVDAPVIKLSEEDTLPLPAADIEARAAAQPDHSPIRPVSDEHVHVPAAYEVDALDHDGDGKAGGSSPRPGSDPERVALFKALDAKGLKYFKGASTEKLKAKLAAS